MQLKITQSTATESRQSEVINLSSISPAISHDAVCLSIADKFYEVHGISEGRKVRLSMQCTCYYISSLSLSIIYILAGLRMYQQ